MNTRVYDALKHAQFIARRLKRFNPDIAANLVLMELAIPVNSDGYDYLRRAIVAKYRHPAQLYMGEIYAFIGARYTSYVSPSCMEFTIRSNIKHAWQRRDAEVWEYYFPADVYGGKKPSNTVFISEIARFLALVELYCKEVSSDEA